MHRSDATSRIPPRPSIGYSTDARLSIGGVLKAEPEDFIVEEIPAYEPAGEGEHLFLWIEKRDVSGDALLGRLARALAISRGEIGMAGLKDRRAVTRQWISVPARVEPAMGSLEIEGVRILSRIRHVNKLKAGHLSGNRFEILLRDIRPDSQAVVEELVQQINQRGVPNLYGDQRFGIDGQTLDLGLALLLGEKSPRDIPYQRRKFLVRLALSSVQSALFNDVLADRLERGELSRVLPGDVMQVVASGGCFLSRDAAADQLRCDAGEIVVTGPMFGPKMMQPEGLPLEAENRALERWNVAADAFSRFKDVIPGTRRPFTMRPGNLIATIEGTTLRLSFELPSGSYATALLREFQKLPPVQQGDAEAP
jgi:tRNA pseudouridine13 synthase